jgi:hypothetical protein
MADYQCMSRSNYFKVKDIEKFNDWVSSLPGDWYSHGSETKEGVMMASETGGPPSDRYDEEKDDYVELDFYKELSQHLQKGEVAVFKEIGWEKLRYLVGQAVAVRWDGKCQAVCLDDVFKKVKSYWKKVPSDCSY